MIKHNKKIGDKKVDGLESKAHSGDKKSPKSKQVHKLSVRVKKDKIIEKPLEERILSDEEFIPDFEEKVEHYVENYVDKLEKTKRMTLVAGVSFFMLLIVFLYAYTFNSQIKATSLADEKSAFDESNTGKLKEDFSSLMDNFIDLREALRTEIDVTSLELEDEGAEIQKNVLPEELFIEDTENNSIEALKEKLLQDSSKDES